MNDAPARAGQSLSDIDTPALVLDLDAFESNIEAFHRQAAAAGLKVRSHGKAHRCPAIALRQIEAGAIGICVQKVGEAEGFAAAGVRDILVSNQIVDPAKCQRLALLARTPALRLAVCVDHPLQIERLAQACRDAGSRIDVLIEIDVGQKRCGVDSIPAALELAALIRAAAPGLELRGLQAYDGRAQHIRQVAERRAAIGAAAELVRRFRFALEQTGHPVSEVSGGGTGSFPIEADHALWTEIQAGSYVLLDLDYRSNELDPQAPVLRQALGVMTTVISGRDTHRVLDAGLKGLAVDSGLPGMRDLLWRVTRVTDEHTVIEPLPGARAIGIGERVTLDPGHCDPTANLHDWIVGIRGDHVETVWPTLPRSASR
jgi:D-serine deaminase-like pyridoxal phosphate-dependent protein